MISLIKIISEIRQVRTTLDEVKDKIRGMIEAYHGEIFEEYYDEAIHDKLSLKGFCETFVQDQEDMAADGDDEDLEKATQYKEMFNQENYLGICKKYFEYASSHGELAGSFAAACVNDKRYDIFMIVYISAGWNHDEGWDS